MWLRVGQLAKMLSARNRVAENGSNWLDWKDARIDLEKGERKYATHRASVRPRPERCGEGQRGSMRDTGRKGSKMDGE